MKNVTFKEVKNKCGESRFFSYSGFNDKLFVPPSIFFTWVFLRLGWSGNAVSILSGIISVIGGILLASDNSTLIIIGSFGYFVYYLLDYVDGSVSRYLGKSGIGGQYLDWTMHVISAVSIFSGLFAGAIIVTGPWIITFGILSIVAAALALSRYSLAWLSICSHFQQQQFKGEKLAPQNLRVKLKKHSSWFRGLRYIMALIFHENYLIFSLPLLAFAHLYLFAYFDFRVILMVIGGTIYFPVIMYEIYHIAISGRIENGYTKLFSSDTLPNLPEDLYFEY